MIGASLLIVYEPQSSQYTVKLIDFAHSTILESGTEQDASFGLENILRILRRISSQF